MTGMAVQTDPVLSTQVMPPFERACRAVLAADVVGYTRLMEAAELETHQRYRTLRSKSPIRPSSLIAVKS